MTNRVVAEGLKFPEGPAFDRDGNLYVVEIAGGQISRIAPEGRVSVFAKPGGGPNGANFGPDGDLYVCNNGGFPGPTKEPGRIERIAPTGEVSVLVREIDGRPLDSPNDLGFDAFGNFYFSDPVWGPAGVRDAPPGSVCFCSASGEVKRLHTGLAFPNGISVSPDGCWLIVCETITNKLQRFAIHEPGVVGAPEVFADLGKGAGPDGFAYDAEGNLLCCGFGSGKIHVFSPAGGDRVDEIVFDDPMVTNVCFGGPDFKTLFVTESGLGRVVSVDWRNPGLVLHPDRAWRKPGS
jgi:gluconolactonase